MTTIVTQVKVKDFAKWREFFDSMEPLRVKHGIGFQRVLQNVDDPNDVTIIGELKDGADFEGYMKLPQLKAAQPHWVGQPTSLRLKDAA